MRGDSVMGDGVRVDGVRGNSVRCDGMSVAGVSGDGVRGDSMRGDGIRVDRVRGDGVMVDGVGVDGVRSDRVQGCEMGVIGAGHNHGTVSTTETVEPSLLLCVANLWVGWGGEIKLINGQGRWSFSSSGGREVGLGGCGLTRGYLPFTKGCVGVHGTVVPVCSQPGTSSTPVPLSRQVMFESGFELAPSALGELDPALLG